MEDPKISSPLMNKQELQDEKIFSSVFGAGKLFQENPALLFIGMFMVTLIVQMISMTTYLMTLERPRAMVVGIVLIFSFLVATGFWLSKQILGKFDLGVPTVVLWFYPLSAMGLVYLFLLAILYAIPNVYGRGIWSDIAQLNTKTTTAMIVTTLVSFKLYIALSFIGATWRYIKAWLEVFSDPQTMREKIAILDECRVRGARFNRYAFAGSLALVGSALLWFIFVRPEAILYLRGEIQIRTGVHSDVALETFRHLAKKFPEYRYLDTVELRSAWVLERRMEKYDEAVTGYEGFLKKYGYRNVWADEAVANIIRIQLDKLKNPTETLKWVEIYRKNFPNGHMLPHIALYEVRACIQLNRRDEAKNALAKALERFRNRHVIIYDSEDDFITTIPFEIAANSIEI